MEMTIRNLDELEQFATDLIARLSERQHDDAVVVALHGDLGAGKTTLVQALARQLGVGETVTSPTFTIMKHYQTESDIFPTLTHIDAYRIEDENEMVVLGLKELLTDPQRLVCIEWAERFKGLLPSNIIDVTLTITQGEQRSIAVEDIDK